MMSIPFVKHTLRSIWTLLAVFALITPALAQTSNEQNVEIRIIAENKTVSGGDTITIGIQQTIRPHWHTYWINPGDSGEPTRIKWSGLDGIRAEPIQWPVPEKIPLGPLTNYGYEDRVVLLQDITFPDQLPAGPVTLSANVSLLVCEEICIPEFGDYTITFNDDTMGDPVTIAEARATIPTQVDWPADYKQKDGKIEFHTTLEKTDIFADLESIEIFPLEPGLIANAADPYAQTTDRGLMISQAVGDLNIDHIAATDAVIAYNNVQGTRKGVMISAQRIQSENTQAVAPVTTDAQQTPTGNSEMKTGFIEALILAILGGLILNLMPCVFPVLSLKALKLSQLQDKEENKARTQGIAYTAGIILSFIAIASVLIGLKAVGAEIGWGFQLQNPVVISVLAYILFLVGLNLSGYFDITGNFMNVGSSLTQKDGLSGSFFTGVLATIVATPCTAPFMGVAMGYALSQPAIISLTVFIALGFGLALPYLALCFIPALCTALPKPGAWMDTFKQFLAFPMFGFAAWLVWVLSQQSGSMGVLLVLLGLVTITFALWLLKKNMRALALIALLVSIAPFFTVETNPYPDGIPNEVAESRNWQAYTPERLALALEQNEPVLVNMTAAWCITCKVNEKVALNIDETKMLFAEKKVQYFKGDWTNRDPAITKFLEDYGRNGVPLYVYYGAKNNDNGERPEPVILPQLLTPAIVRKTINQF